MQETEILKGAHEVINKRSGVGRGGARENDTSKRKNENGKNRFRQHSDKKIKSGVT